MVHVPLTISEVIIHKQLHEHQKVVIVSEEMKSGMADHIYIEKGRHRPL